jgi:hypothetical protein
LQQFLDLWNMCLHFEFADEQQWPCSLRMTTEFKLRFELRFYRPVSIVLSLEYTNFLTTVAPVHRRFEAKDMTGIGCCCNSCPIDTNWNGFAWRMASPDRCALYTENYREKSKEQNNSYAVLPFAIRRACSENKRFLNF